MAVLPEVVHPAAVACRGALRAVVHPEAVGCLGALPEDRLAVPQVVPAYLGSRFPASVASAVVPVATISVRAATDQASAGAWHCPAALAEWDNPVIAKETAKAAPAKVRTPVEPGGPALMVPAVQAVLVNIPESPMQSVQHASAKNWMNLLEISTMF